MIADELLQDASFRDLKEVIEASTLHYEVIGASTQGAAGMGSIVSSSVDGGYLVIIVGHKLTKEKMIKHTIHLDPMNSQKNVDNLKEVCDKILMTLIDTGLGYLNEKKIVIDGEGNEVPLGTMAVSYFDDGVGGL
jgi:hypothetical protein